MGDERVCEFCEWNGGFYAALDHSVTENTIKCRRNPPIVTGGMLSRSMTIWPSVWPDDWCGEFAAKLKDEGMK